MPPRKDVKPGDKYGRWAVIGEAEPKGSRRHFCCVCDCGNERIVEMASLIHGRTKSCGCLRKDVATILKTKHKQRYTRLYKTWANMRQRCSNPNTNSYQNYGGRGIAVCDEWKDFANFYAWATPNGYSGDLSIERVNNDGNYEPSNCKWITLKAQARNRRNNHLITHNGTTKNLEEWAELTGISASTIRHRLKRGWPINKTLEKPTRG